jgi:response regulator RpfG family c-di-GMP phosphodiesterase
MPSLSTRQVLPRRSRNGREEVPPLSTQALLRELLASSLVMEEDWEALSTETREKVDRAADRDELLALLVEHGLLTEYQAARVEAGTAFGLVLGNYRVLDRIGAGGMGVVFKAEHIDMRRVVAIKVLAQTHGEDTRLLQRFLAEMRAVARLHHPNIVAAIDAGKAQGPGPDAPLLRYLVMEYVAGLDLEELVKANGPFGAARACDLIYQVAAALAEAHKANLVHRDIKPSNVLVTPEDQAKLLDFGLAQQFGRRMTEPGTLLGTVEYMAPEQARDASTVDVRADVYGLGATLFWCLAGEPPFPSTGNLIEDLGGRLERPPPSLRERRPEVPAALDEVVARMMALHPEDRYPTATAVMRALLPFLKPDTREQVLLQPQGAAPEVRFPMPGGLEAVARTHHVLLVDDEPGIRTFCRLVLQAEGIHCDETDSGVGALDAVARKAYDVVLLDINMPALSGMDVLCQLRTAPPSPHLKVIMISGRYSSDEMAQMLLAGADDYLTKPFSVVQLHGRVKSVLRLKDAQDRSELLNRHLLAVNAELELNLNSRDSDLVHARNGLVLALAKLVAHRDIETGAHLMRLQRYCRTLAEEAAGCPTFASQIDQNFVEMLACCAPLHDIGKVGLPDHILMKPGKLTQEERILMQAHTLIGADTLHEVARQYPFALGFLQMAIDICRHHHERCDGSGYPDRLAGSDIPLSARLVAIADVYDALRSRRVYKPALSHAAALQIMTEASPGHFDQALLPVFGRCADRFDAIFRELMD